MWVCVCVSAPPSPLSPPPLIIWKTKVSRWLYTHSIWLNTRAYTYIQTRTHTHSFSGSFVICSNKYCSSNNESTTDSNGQRSDHAHHRSPSVLITIRWKCKLCCFCWNSLSKIGWKNSFWTFRLEFPFIFFCFWTVVFEYQTFFAITHHSCFFFLAVITTNNIEKTRREKKIHNIILIPGSASHSICLNQWNTRKIKEINFWQII